MNKTLNIANRILGRRLIKENDDSKLTQEEIAKFLYDRNLSSFAAEINKDKFILDDALMFLQSSEIGANEEIYNKLVNLYPSDMGYIMSLMDTLHEYAYDKKTSEFIKIANKLVEQISFLKNKVKRMNMIKESDDNYIDLGWSNGWKETPAIVKNCQEVLKHGLKSEKWQNSKNIYKYSCDICKYFYVTDESN